MTATIRKFLVAAAAAASAIVTANVFTGSAQTWAVTISSVLGALLVYAVKNEPPAA